eukprot:CAMPEP_0196254502 /NCGR_PEP_ID=MMETSP0913-20130531/54133_1 /TAXON_ID=49265 /ORGANISM="Thalassiosira rotula, Strain GSO102" /LENGTH=35 /DNA_ID= /DNA_START= /DNA_END= /DNA_ORIENTATION=
MSFYGQHLVKTADKFIETTITIFDARLVQLMLMVR